MCVMSFMDGPNIYGWIGIEETGDLGEDSTPAGIPCWKFEAEGLTSVEMMIFIQKHAATFLAKGKNEKISLHY